MPEVDGEMQPSGMLGTMSGQKDPLPAHKRVVSDELAALMGKPCYDGRIDLPAT
jgi:hypothetical protein